MDSYIKTFTEIPSYENFGDKEQHRKHTSNDANL